MNLACIDGRSRLRGQSLVQDKEPHVRRRKRRTEEKGWADSAMLDGSVYGKRLACFHAGSLSTVHGETMYETTF